MICKKIIHYLFEEGIEKPALEATVCHHSASLAMPNGDPRADLFYPTLGILTVYSYIALVYTVTC